MHQEIFEKNIGGKIGFFTADSLWLHKLCNFSIKDDRTAVIASNSLPSNGEIKNHEIKNHDTHNIE